MARIDEFKKEVATIKGMVEALNIDISEGSEITTNDMINQKEVDVIGKRISLLAENFQDIDAEEFYKSLDPVVEILSEKELTSLNELLKKARG